MYDDHIIYYFLKLLLGPLETGLAIIKLDKTKSLFFLLGIFLFDILQLIENNKCLTKWTLFMFFSTLFFNEKPIKDREIEVFKKSFPFKVRFIVFAVGAY